MVELLDYYHSGLLLLRKNYLIYNSSNKYFIDNFPLITIFRIESTQEIVNASVWVILQVILEFRPFT